MKMQKIMSLVNLFYRRSIISYLLLPFSLLYSIILILRRNHYRNNPNKSYRSRIIVISVGNIVLGGSGKTPFTIYLASLIKKLGYSVAVSHRGYKGELESRVTIISNEKGMRPIATKSGDEAILLAEKLPGVPIIVGKDRKKAIQTLEREFPNLDFIILDDSFQHLKVKHNHDFVLFKDLKLKKKGVKPNWFVFPAGPLREPFSSLRDADTVVKIRAAANDSKALPIPDHIQKLSGSFQINGFFDSQDKVIPIETLRTSRVALISAIGQPASFEETVNENGIKFINHYIFPDHHSFKDSISVIIDEFKKKDVDRYDYLLTTEKDWTKLKEYAKLLPFVILSISFVPDEEEAFVNIIRNLIVSQQSIYEQ